MSRFLEPSHMPETGMPGLAVTGSERCRFAATAKTATVLDHRASAPLYAGQAAVAVARAACHTPTGTCVASPRGRFRAGCEAEPAA